MHASPFSDLADLGWSDRWTALAAAHDLSQPHLRIGRVTRVDKGHLVASCPDPVQSVVEVFRLPPDCPPPATGDWVVLDCSQDPARPIDVLTRSSALLRADVDNATASQALAANVDDVVLVHPLDRPARPGRLERELLIAWDSGARPLVVATKADTVDAATARKTVKALEGAAPGVDVLTVSSTERAGLDELMDILAPGRSAVFIGPSGAGKSTLLNALATDELAATGAVRDEDHRGRHTTTSRQLYVLPSGLVVIDTPGTRSLGVWESGDLGQVFPEIESVLGQCRFADCSHGPEPDCAITAALAAGTIDPARLERWHKLNRELAHVAKSRDEQVRKSGGRRQYDPEHAEQHRRYKQYREISRNNPKSGG